MQHIILTLLLAMSAFGTASGQHSDADHRRILAAVDGGEYSTVITELQNLEKSEPKVFTINNYDYLLARMSESGGEISMAVANYISVVRRDSILKAYALFHLSRIFRQSGNLLLERIYLNQLLTVSQNSLLTSAARHRLAKCAFEGGNFAETARVLTSTTGQSAPRNTAATDRFRREDDALLGQAYLFGGKTGEARQIFERLLVETPNQAQPDDVALSSTQALDLMDSPTEKVGKEAPELSETEHIRRASIYQFNRDFSAAKLHYDAVIGKFANSSAPPDAIFMIGRGFAQQANYTEALKWFERVQEQYPGSSTVKEALLQSASAYGRVGKSKEAITRYQKFIANYPTDEKLDRAYLNMVDILRDQGDELEALKWTAKAREAFKGKMPEALAVFAEARIFISRAEWKNALDALERLSTFSDLGGVTVPGGTNKDEITFLKAQVLEKLSLFEDAVSAYLSIPDGRNEYYGWRATERLRMLAGDETARPFIVQKLGILSSELKAKDADERRRVAQGVLRLTVAAEIKNSTLEVLQAALKSLPVYQGTIHDKQSKVGHRNVLRGDSPASSSGAEELLFLGLYDEAASQFEAALPAVLPNGANPPNLLGNIYRLGERADRTIAFVEPLWKKIPADYPVDLIERDSLQMLYPAPYRDALLKYATPRNVDPRLMLAIMRQESRFQPDAKSYAAARGLMQFISTTSTKIAGELGRDTFQQEELYYPPTAILFGAQYISDLFKQFPDQPQAVVASYNGGDDNMKRWLARSKSNDPDTYVPEIAYAQSKDYVVKVMAGYRMYQLIYDENLRPR